MTGEAVVPVPDRRTYLTGFGAALVLTVIPFAIVYWALLPAVPALAVIAVAAVAQIVVQLRFFLHIDFKRTPRENLMALFFAGFLILVMVGGSLWIMFDLHYRHRIDATATNRSEGYSVALVSSSGATGDARLERAKRSVATSRNSPTSTVRATAA